MKPFLKPRWWEVIVFLLPIVGLAISTIFTVFLAIGTLMLIIKGSSVAVVKHSRMNQIIIFVGNTLGFIGFAGAYYALGWKGDILMLGAMLSYLTIGSMVIIAIAYHIALREVSETAVLWKHMAKKHKEKARV